MNQTPAEVIYLYGFVGPDAPAPAADLRGLEDREVEVLQIAGFNALFSALPAHTYGQEVLSDRVKDLGWVGPRGLLHERVVTWYVDRGGILPAPFLTLYSSMQALSQEGEKRSEVIRKGLSQLAGMREWNLKVSYDPARLDAHLGSRSAEIERFDREIASSAPGRRYLLERQRSQVASGIMEKVAGELAQELLGDLRRYCDAVKVIPIPRDLAGVQVVLNAALLVEMGRERALRERVEAGTSRLADQGIEVSFSGPWAPYRFVGMTEEPSEGSSERESGKVGEV